MIAIEVHLDAEASATMARDVRRGLMTIPKELSPKYFSDERGSQLFERITELEGVGRAWEWTSSDFLAYPGFEAFPYPEYSEVFFGDAHKVLRGGSWATHPSVMRPSFRNWDLAERRQILSGIRCARDA